jgi:hypothetical protein
MIHVPEPRLSECLLAYIFQAMTTLAANISLVHCIENQYPLMHEPAVWWWSGRGIQ